MEAPGEDELEWMAMQERQHFLDDSLHELEQLDEVPESGITQDEEEVELLLDALQEHVPGKRRKLVFPDVDLPPRKSQKAEAETTLPVVQEAEMDQVFNSSVGNQLEVTKDGEKLPRKRAADISGCCISITGPCGQRVYAEVSQQLAFETLLPNASEVPLLREPINKIMEKMEREQFEQICNQVAARDPENSSMRVSHTEQLWVEKYAPKSFTELLSNEQTNREILSWLKQWDPCVYGTKQIPSSRKALRHSSHLKNRDSLRKNVGGAIGEVVGDRPEQKVLLLCGPPGLGKTTLAHVAARHCGYRVVELNASDDRSGSAFQGKVLDAIQMKPVIGESRPNCLVIDEIDGALNGAEGKSAITFLLGLVSPESVLTLAKETESETAETKKSTKKSKERKLSRPIICICNDLYAPALRPLRQVARVYAFTPPSPHRIVSRLNFICDSEGYKVNSRALTALAVHTECDIRSCLNTLQFLHRKGQSLHEMDVASQIVGKKDMTSGMFDIWLEIFHVKKRKLGSIDALTGSKQEQKDFIRLHDLFENHGEYDLVIDGIHENLLRSRFQDANSLQKMIQSLDLISDSDILAQRTISQQQFFLNAYRPAINIAVRRVIAQPTRPTLEWPKSYQRHRQELAANSEILRCWMTSISPDVLRSLPSTSLVQDVVSPFLSILAPPLRPVASHLMSQQESEAMKELIDTMIIYGVSYKRSRHGSEPFTENKMNPSGSFLLHPALYNLISFKDYAHGYPQLPLTLQQILVHEMELEVIKRGRRPQESESSKRLSYTKVPMEHAGSSSGKETTSLKAQAKPAKQAFNFFDSFRKAPANGEKRVPEKSTVKRDSRPVIFRFQEGFTNAVKRPVLIRDLMH